MCGDEVWYCDDEPCFGVEQVKCLFVHQRTCGHHLIGCHGTLVYILLTSHTCCDGATSYHVNHWPVPMHAQLGIGLRPVHSLQRSVPIHTILCTSYCT